VAGDVDNQARRLFARALTEAVRRAGLSQVEVSERTGGAVSQSTISEWMSATKPPGAPQAVFAVERALTLPPGALSGYLGYLPKELFRVSVETAIAVDRAGRQFLCQSFRPPLDGPGRSVSLFRRTRTAGQST
jgi:transcriptional regulator with XRE-family HTH domain